MASFPALGSRRRAVLDGRLGEIIALAEAGIRLIEGDVACEFESCEEPWLVENPAPSAARGDGYHRTYAVGTRLLYEAEAIVARAVVQSDAVMLEPESLVRLQLGESVGAKFAREHKRFLAAAGTIPIDGQVGRTTEPAWAPTAAALIKRVSGGRVHNSDRWQTYPPHLRSV
jgi:hypothetical protein